MSKSLLTITETSAQTPNVQVCAFGVHPDFYISHNWNDMQRFSLYFHMNSIFVMLIILVGKFYVRAFAIMAIDGRISSETNISTPVVVVTVHNVFDLIVSH